MFGRSKPSISFTRFFADATAMRLTLGQRTWCKVAFDGVEPRDLAPGEREVARQMFGALDVVPLLARGVVAQVKGARVGGTLIASIRLLHLALTAPVKLARGELAYAIACAPDMRLARQALRYAEGAAEAHGPIAKMIEDRGTDGFTLRRPDGVRVRLECLPATRGGSALRGRSVVAAVLSEASFFRDESSVVNDVEVFRAVNARIVAAGQLVIESTPWAESGLLHELFEENFGRPKTALLAHCPTSLMRDDEHTRSIVARERERDPINCEREFDAEFMAAGAGLFFDSATLESAIVSTAIPEGGVTFGAADLAFTNDGSAIVIVRVVDDGKTYLVGLDEVRPTKGSPLKPSEVAARFTDFARGHGVASLLTDVHHRESARESFGQRGVQLLSGPEGQSGKVASYVHVRTSFAEGRIALPASARPSSLVAQLKSIIAKPTPGGALAISAPRRAGNHCDAASAFVLAVWASRWGAPYVSKFNSSPENRRTDWGAARWSPRASKGGEPLELLPNGTFISPHGNRGGGGFGSGY